jgi:cytosine/adenosine deaminase-related metal-dependent hydrolase
LQEGEFLMPGFVDTHTVRPASRQSIHVLTIFCISSMRVKFLISACKYSDSSTHDLTLYTSFSGGEMELLQWLDNYTFPTEARFKDVGYAKRAYPDVVRRIVNSGVSDPSNIHFLNYHV